MIRTRRHQLNRKFCTDIYERRSNYGSASFFQVEILIAQKYI